MCGGDIIHDVLNLQWICIKMKNIGVVPQAINQRDIIKFQAWARPYVNFPYLVRAPLLLFQK